MAEKPHARLSCSGASRWMVCPASVDESEHAPRQPASDAAIRGDRIHERAEQLLKGDPVQDDSADDRDIIAIAKDFRDYVSSHHFEQQWIETRVYVSDDCWGTADVIGVKDDELYIIDLKSGSYPVFAEENPQLMIYAIGALKKFLPGKVFKNIHLIIYQPQIQNFDEFLLNQKELLDWYRGTLKPAIAAATSTNPRYTAGAHCRFCHAKDSCTYRSSTLYKTALEMEQAYRTARVGDMQRLVDTIMGSHDMLAKWLKDVKDQAYAMLSSGVELETVYLSPGRRMRTIDDEQAFINQMTEAGVPLTDLVNLKSVAQLEKVVEKSILAWHTREVPTASMIKVKKDVKKRNY